MFAPASAVRARVVPKTHPGRGTDNPAQSATEAHQAMSWAQRLKRVFAIDIQSCQRCGARLRVIATIEDPAVIARILDHLGRDEQCIDPAHPSRAPPQSR